LNKLLGLLAKTIIDLKYIIVYSEEDKTNNDLRILYEIPHKEFMWYYFDTKTIDDIEAEELKIGFAHFLYHFGKSCEHNALDSDYENTVDNPYEMQFEMLSDEEIAFDENDEFDEEHYEKISDKANEELQTLRVLKEKFNFYNQKPLELFLDYEPKNDLEKGFKECLIEGLDIPFRDIMVQFMPDEDIYNDGGIGFDMNFVLYLDPENEFEKEHFTYMNENANNGISNPCGWYSVSEGILEQMTSDEDAKNLFYIQCYLENIYTQFLNKM